MSDDFRGWHEGRLARDPDYAVAVQLPGLVEAIAALRTWVLTWQVLRTKLPENQANILLSGQNDLSING